MTQTPPQTDTTADSPLFKKTEAPPAENPFTTAANAEPIMRYFAYAHLPPKLQPVSKLFGDLALELELFTTLPRSAERAAGLRKLLEAKDCAVRAALP